MIKEVEKIQIIPARFVRKQGKNYVVKCLVDIKQTQNFVFEEFSLMGMKKPKYLLIGLMIGRGFEQITFIDAREFEKYFKTKWKILTK
jgi:hypothetical protein